MVRQTSKWGQIFLLSLVGLGATAFTTAWFYRIDEVITVQGRLVPRSGGVEVKSPISGQLANVMVENGVEVKKGDTLLSFDVESAESQAKTYESQLKLEEKRLSDQIKSNEQRQETLLRNLEFTQSLLERLVPLEEGGAISEIQVLQQKNQMESRQDELIQLQTKQEEIINESRIRESELRGSLEQIRNQLKNEFLKAPISGIVFDLKADNNSYVATNAEALLKIVPKGKLGGEVNIGNEDIGFIKEGQEVKVRINAFPYTEYGEIDGKVARIGADALPPSKVVPYYYFPVDISLDRSNLETREGLKIPLQAGMTITTNMKLRDRRLITLLSDLFSNKSDSLKRLRQP